MKKIINNKKSSTKTIVRIILLTVAFFLLLGFLNNLFLQENKESYSAACKLQFTAASQGKVAGFDECYSYRLIFEEENAKKNIITKEEEKLYKKYNYETIFDNLKNIGLIERDIIIEGNKIPEEVIFFILSEEIKSCFSVYVADNFKTFTNFKNKNSHMCHSCDLIMFDQDFQLADEDTMSMSKLKAFFENVPAYQKDLTYSEYIEDNYNYEIDTQYQKDSVISKYSIYNLLITYDKSSDLNKDVDKEEDYYVSTSHVALINQDFFSDVCSCTLTLAPTSIGVKLDSYENLLNEAILFMV